MFRQYPSEGLGLESDKEPEEMEKNRGLQFDPELIDEWVRFCEGAF